MDGVDMSEKKVTVLLVGINGYAKGYLKLMLQNAAEHGAVIAGIADPTASASEFYPEITARSIPVYNSMDEFYGHSSADLAVISTPIQLHSPHLQTALENGSNVLCEKPLCSTIDEALQMQQVADSSKLFTAIGFNWSFSSTIQQIKKDVLDGLYGAPKRMKSIVFWPRAKSYYDRCNWAGKQKHPGGAWVLDSPLSNATSHFLHNMLYVCGDSVSAAADPLTVEAELYRANPIDNFDTAMVRVVAKGGVEICFYTTHAVNFSMNPLSYYEFENGTISHCGYGTDFTGRLSDGTVKRYGTDPFLNSHDNKLWQCIDLCRTGGKPVCDVKTATALTKVVNGAQLSCRTITGFEEQMISVEEREDGDQLRYVPDLQQFMFHCYDSAVLPSQTGMFDWAASGEVVDISNLTHFSM